MKRWIAGSLFALSTFALVGLIAQPVGADECVPFMASGAGDGQIVDTRGNCFTIVGTGSATHMGEVALYIEVCQYGFRAESERILTAADGDKLYLSTETFWNEENQRFEGTFTIDGGTGRFEGATGGGCHIQGVGSFGEICY